MHSYRDCEGDGDTPEEVQEIIAWFRDHPGERVRRRALLLRQLSMPCYQCITASIQAQLAMTRHAEHGAPGEGGTT